MTRKTEFNPTDLAEKPKREQDRQTLALIESQSEAADFKWLMGSKRGRRIVWRQLEATGVFRSSFNTNAMQMAFAEGNKNFGFGILAKIHSLTPDLYPLMMRESHDRTSSESDE